MLLWHTKITNFFVSKLGFAILEYKKLVLAALKCPTVLNFGFFNPAIKK